SAGMVGMNYYMFVERERWEGFCPVTENGKIREEWFAHRHMFRILHEVDWKNLSRESRLGLLWYQEHYWHFLYEGGGIIQPDDYTLVASKDYGHLAQEPLWLYTKALVDADVDFDVVDIRTELSRYPLLIYAAPPFLGREEQDKLAEYVEGGGTLVFLSPPPHMDVELRECRSLMEELGIERGREVNLKATLNLGGRSFRVYVAESYEDLDAEPFLRTEEGNVCACRRKVDEGWIYLVGFSALEREVLTGLLDALGAPAFVRSDDPFVHTSLHRNGERAVVVAINRGTEARTVRIKIFPDLGLTSGHQVEEMFTRRKLEISADQVLELHIPGKDVAVVEVRKEGVERVDLDKEELIQGYFKL
ncbi:MAG TPA: hypothetical protein EYP61_04415, partial [Candidatus Latescibacteria bacterium]|nr:hypothetical protein [Candidatus Latescibacterota bacterium]